MPPPISPRGLLGSLLGATLPLMSSAWALPSWQDLLPALAPVDDRTYGSDYDEIWEEGETLPKKSGEHWFFEEGRRGRYFIGGKTKRPKGLLIGMHGGGVGSPS